MEPITIGDEEDPLPEFSSTVETPRPFKGPFIPLRREDGEDLIIDIEQRGGGFVPGLRQSLVIGSRFSLRSPEGNVRLYRGYQFMVIKTGFRFVDNNVFVEVLS